MHPLRFSHQGSPTPAAVTSPPIRGQDKPPSATSSVMRSKRMSTLSEQEHLNPRDPRYYAPRSLRQKRIELCAGQAPRCRFLLPRFDSRSRARIPCAAQRLDPEVMHEPGYGVEEGLADHHGALRCRHRHRGLVALFFVVVVPASRQPDGEASARSPRSCSRSRPRCSSPARRKLRRPACAQRAPGKPRPWRRRPSAIRQRPSRTPQLLNQFMQWREKPDPAAP